MQGAKPTTLFDDFSAYCRREYSPVYSAQLLKLLGRSSFTVDVIDVTPTQIELFFRRAGREWSLSYLRKMHGAASVFFEWTARTGRTSVNPMQGTPRAIEYSPNKELQVTPAIYLEYAQHLRNLNRSEDTIVQRVGDIRRFAGDSDPLAMTPQDLSGYLREHRFDWAQEYRRKIRASFVSFYSWTAKVGHIQADPTLNLQSIRAGKPPRSPIIEDDLLEAFYSAELEEQVIIALAGSLGLRRMEITVLHTRDRNGRILTVHGKGDKVRFVPLNDLCFELLVELERKQGPGYYLRNKRTGHHLHPSTVYKHAKAYIGSWCLHSLRHRAATIGLRRGGNLRGIQELLGHLNLSTTQIYAAISIEDIEHITSKTSWPRSKCDETTRATNILTVDLDNLSSADVATIADALSRHLQEQAVAA